MAYLKGFWATFWDNLILAKHFGTFDNNREECLEHILRIIFREPLESTFVDKILE